jgi:hypothetical protein
LKGRCITRWPPIVALMSSILMVGVIRRGEARIVASDSDIADPERYSRVMAKGMRKCLRQSVGVGEICQAPVGPQPKNTTITSTRSDGYRGFQRRGAC